MSNLQFYACIRVKNGLASVVFLNLEAIEQLVQKKGPDDNLRLQINDESVGPWFCMYVRQKDATQLHKYRYFPEAFPPAITKHLNETKRENEYRNVIWVIKYSDPALTSPIDIVPTDLVVAETGKYAEGLLKQWAESV